MIALAFIFGIPIFGDVIGLQMGGMVFNLTLNYSYACIPMFILMGEFLGRAGIAERLFEAIDLWTGRIAGGYAVTAVVISLILSSCIGVIGAVIVLMCLLAVPSMMRRGYNKGLIAGTCMAGGALATITPPSIIAVVYGIQAEIPIGDMFAGIAVPGLMLAIGYILYIIIRCAIRPQDGPKAEQEKIKEYGILEKVKITIKSVLPVVMLVLIVLGSILTGFASPTEASAVGAFGSFLLCVCYRKFNWKILRECCEATLKSSSMVFIIILGGVMFSSVFITNGGNAMVQRVVSSMDLSPDALVFLMLLFAFLIAFVIDCYALILVLVPIFAPLIKSAGLNPLWFAVLFCLIVQTSYLTPPVAPAVFFFKGAAPPEIKMKEMFIGAVPFLAIQILVLLLVWKFPDLATWLPSIVYSR